MSSLAKQAWRYFSQPEMRGPRAHEVFARLAAEAPVVRYDGAWLISGYDLVTTFANEPRCSMPRPDFPAVIRRENPDFVDFFSSSMSVRGADAHRRLRAALTREFTGRAVERLRPRIVEIVDELLAQPLRRGAIEFVSEVAVPLPVMVTAALLDLPRADWRHVLGWAQGLTAQISQSFPMGARDDTPPISASAFRDLRGYVDDLVRERAHSDAPDLISRLGRARVAGQLSHDELVNMVLLLFMTGFDTVTGGLTNTLYHLAGHPELWRRIVAEPGLSGAAFSESIRLLTPVIMGVRVADEDIPFAGRTVQAGDMILLGYAAANLDQRRFDRPQEFRLDRPATANVSFGHGTYFCIGAALAALQADVLLRRLAATAPGLRLGTTEVHWRAEIAFNTLVELPLRLDAGTGTATDELALAGGRR
jgi:cytochrome P450